MDGRLLSDLKVADLRRELERRLKDKSGVKQVLVDRLREALEEEGLDPHSYRFGLDAESSKDTEVMDRMSVNEDDVEFEKSPANSGIQIHADAVLEEQPEQKKLNDETVPFVVQVGDQEDDLDYDLKTDAVQQEIGQSTESGDVKQESTKISEDESGKGENHGPGLRNLWVSNLPRSVKAADLKQHLSKAGKVLSATVVMSTRTPGGCFGFIEMASAEDAKAVTEKFNGSEFNGAKLVIEATEKKSPTHATKATDLVGAGRKTTPPKTKTARPMNNRPISFVRARRFAPAMRRRTRRIERPTRMLLQSPRLPAPLVRPERIARPIPSLLAYQSLRRARMMAASRYSLVRGLQQALERPLLRARLPRAPPVLSRSTLRYSTDPWVTSTRYSVPERRYSRPLPRPVPVRRQEPRSPPVPERRRAAEPVRLESRSRPPPPPRRSEPIMRRPSPPTRPRMPPPMSPIEHRRPFQPSRSSLETSRYEKSGRPFNGSRTFGRPDRTEFSRPMKGASNGGRYSAPTGGSSISQVGSRYKPQYATQTSQPGPRTPPSHPGPRDSLPPSRRDYRAMSRSPPRSRDAALVRPYPAASPQHRMNRVSRDRSPLHSTGPRPKVVDYGHRSEPRPDWSPWRDNGPSIQTPSGHTWKPLGQSMISSSSNRGPGRRYP